MSYQFLLFQSLSVILIASSAYGGQLPEAVTFQYAFCLEMVQFSYDASTHASSLVDNVCKERNSLTYHFLSSTQGGTLSYIVVPRSGMSVIFFDYDRIGIKVDVDSLDHPPLSLVCQFVEPAHTLIIYHDIYRYRRLNRLNISIRLIQKLILDRPTRSQIAERSILALDAGLYMEFYRNEHLVFTLKEESSRPDTRNPVLVFFANKCNISDAPTNNNVVLRFEGSKILTVILTFRDESVAENFCNSVRPYVNPAIAIPIPPAVQQILQTTRAP